MHALNIRVSNTQSHIKPVHNIYKYSRDNILDNNIDNIVAKIMYIKLESLKQNASVTQSYMLQNNDILLLSKNFQYTDSKADEHLSSSLTR